MKTNAFCAADILIPKKAFEKWAVVACDQFTSDRTYWEECERIVGESPSSLRLILPEIYLSDNNDKKIEEINKNMSSYLESGIFRELKDTMIYIERKQKNGQIRHGLLLAVDLEKYDYKKGAKTPIRATEETVPERLPPRVYIRSGAVLELPHIMLLIDDPKNTVMGALGVKKETFEKLYDFELMQGGGHIAGYSLTNEEISRTCDRLDALATGDAPLLFAVGDGNHSLAAAKECYLKNPTSLNRYALCEVVNIHDPSLTFEPIYRVLFGIGPETLLCELQDFFGTLECKDGQTFSMLYSGREQKISLRPLSTLPVGTLQRFIDSLCRKHPEIKVDYVHEIDTVVRLSKEKDTVGFIFEGMKKDELFPAVINDGALVRKTFSMGEGCDKRYYIEARRIG